MSGLEVVGVVLGTFPLLIGALRTYPKAARTVRDWSRFRIAIDEHIDTLSTQRIIFWDRVVQLLDDIVPSVELDRLYRGGDLGGFQHLNYGNKSLEKRLGAEKYRLFVKHTERIAESLQQIERMLCVDEKAKIPWDRAGFIRRERGKFRLVISKDELQYLFGKIRQANDDLEALTRRNVFVYDDRNPQNQRRRACYTENVAHVRLQAQSLLRVIMDPLKWRCKCQRHTSTLQLSGAQHKDQPTRLRLHFSYRTGGGTFGASISRTWKCLEADFMEVPKVSNEKAILTLKQSPKVVKVPFLNRFKAKKVRFSPTEVQPPEQVTSSGVEKPQTSNQIQNLCVVLDSLRGSGVRDLVGHLVDEYALTQHLLYRSPQIELQLELYPLRTLLDVTRSQANRPAYTQTELLWDQRLQLAILLALGVLRLGGSWIENTWTSRDILLLKEGQSVNTGQPYIQRDIVESRPAIKATAPTSSLASCIIRSEAIFSLGLMLVELAFSQPLEELYQSEDKDAAESLQKLKTATRLLPKIEGDRGSKFHQATKACLLVPSSLPSTSLDDKRFQDYVLAEIVTPMMDDHEIMFGLRP